MAELQQESRKRKNECLVVKAETMNQELERDTSQESTLQASTSQASTSQASTLQASTLQASTLQASTSQESTSQASTSQSPAGQSTEKKQEIRLVKQRTTVETEPINLEDFSFHNVRIRQQGDFLEFIPTNGQPIYLQFDPNGIIPKKFGLKPDNFGHMKLSTNVENQDALFHGKRLDDELDGLALAHGEAWRKAAMRPEGWVPKFGPFFSQSILKPNQTKQFPPLFTCDWSDAKFEARKLRVRNKSNPSVLLRNTNEIPNSKCRNLVFELKGAKLGNYSMKKLADGKEVKQENRGGLSKEVKLLMIEKNTDYYCYIYPSDMLTHDPSCPCKHIISIDLKTLDPDQDLELHPMIFSDPSSQDKSKHRVPSARITKKGTDCPVYLRATGGGTYPKFAMSYNKEFKTIRESWTLNDQAEKDGLKRLLSWLKRKSVELRDVWFPDVPREVKSENGDDDNDVESEGVDDKYIAMWAKGILGPLKPKKDKENKIMEGQFWNPIAKLSIDPNDFQEPFFQDETEEEAAIRVAEKRDSQRLYNLKNDSLYRVVDVDGNRISDLAQLAYATWTEKEFIVRNVFLQEKKTQFATRSVFTRLGHSKEDYVPKEQEYDPEPEVEESSAQPNE